MRRAEQLSAHRAWWSLVVIIVLVALGTRLGPGLVADGLRQPADDDAGVYFGAAQHVIAGRLPYRDFLFVQPPGIALLLSPFAALALVISDASAFECVRIASALVGTANALLVARLLRPYGLIAAALGGLVYASWATTATSESSALLEPLLDLALLVTLLALRRERTLTLVGGLLGAALAVKIWAVADVVVLMPVLWVRRGRRAALSWLGGVALAAAVLIGPLALLAPGAAWRAIVVDQLGRGYDGRTVLDRLTFFLGRFRTQPATGSTLALAAVFGLAMLAGVVAVLARAARQRRLGDAGVWALLLLAHLALLATAPSFYYHYANYAAPLLCLLLGWGVAGLSARAGLPAVRVSVIAAGIALVTALAFATAVTTSRRTVRYPELIDFAARHRCVWSDTWMLLVSNDAATRSVDSGCSTWVDRFAHSLVAADGKNPTPPVVRELPAYQHALRRQFAASDAMIVSRKGTWFWSDATKAWVHQHFTVVERVGDYTLFVARP